MKLPDTGSTIQMPASQNTVKSSAQAECPRPLLLIPGREPTVYAYKIIYFWATMTINFDPNTLEIKIGGWEEP